MLFLTLWLLFVYFPFVHMIWGGGILQKWGVLDFAGGIVVHNIAGMAALASVLYVGRRRVMDGGAAQHSAGGARHRPALVRLVRLQRRQRVPRRLGDGRRLPQHRRRGLVRGDRLAGGRLVAGEAAELRRPADRRGRRPGHHHAGGGLRLAGHRGDHRHRRRASSATSRWRSRTGCAGTTRSTSGASTASAASSGIVLLGVFASTAFNPAGADGLLAGNPTLLRQAARRGRCSRRSGPSSSPTGCCG